jgi:hypothetical protein
MRHCLIFTQEDGVTLQRKIVFKTLVVQNKDPTPEMFRTFRGTVAPHVIHSQLVAAFY